MSKDQLNAELDKKDWDLSVKALAPFPQVLAMMDDHLDWTTKLGEAFLNQQSEVMASIQGLRSKAYAKGNLRTTEQQKVVVAGEDIEIQPADPETVYVPYYDPMSVYGDWWWPGYLPYAFFPFWGPFLAWGPFGFGFGIGVGPFWGAGWGSWNWGGGFANLNRNRNANINRNDPGITRNMRTANSNRLASGRGAGLGRGAGRLGAGRTGAGGRPTAASVQRALSQGRTGLSHGRSGSRGTSNVARGGSRGTSNAARGGNFGRGGSRGTGNAARGGSFARGGSRGTGNVARGSSFGHGRSFSRGGFGGFHGGGFAHSGGFGGFHGGGGGFGGFHGGGGGHFGGGGGGHR